MVNFMFVIYFSALDKKCDKKFSVWGSKACSSHGARTAAKKYGVSETAVRGFVKSLKRQQAHNPDVDFIALPQK